MSSTVLGLTRCPLHSLSRLLVLYLPWVDSVSPTFVQSTACPGPLLGCLQVDTFLRRLCVDYHFLCLHPVNYLSSRRLHLSYTWKPRAPRKSQVLCNLEQCVYRPSSYWLLHFLLYLCRLLVRVNYLLMSTTPYIKIFLTYRVQFKISSMSGLWTAPGYLGDVGRRTVMRSGTVVPKRPAVAMLGHASPKSRLLMARIGSSIVSRTLCTFDPAT